VTRIVVELPAQRLREGVVYVDTPGLGSLATSGAAETRAYLPGCDLGVLLIDAGSTLTQDDLATIETLFAAGIPASVALSKADLLAPADRDRALEYIAGHIRSDLGLEMPVRAISIKTEYSYLLENWLATEILPLYGRHAELARQSLNRKIGALRVGVEAALQARLKHSNRSAAIDGSKVRDLETDLRTAAGKIAQARSACVETTDALHGSADNLIRAAAKKMVEAWESTGAASEPLVHDKLEQAAAEAAAQIAAAIREAARNAGSVLAKSAVALGLENGPEQDELLDVLKNMPRLDLGSLEIELKPGAPMPVLGRRWAVGQVERRIRSEAAKEISGAVEVYARVLQSWVRKTFTELQEQFDSYAGAYRAHLDRLAANKAEGADEQTLRGDLASLAAVPEAASKL
jgi:hypothetical protein